MMKKWAVAVTIAAICMLPSQNAMAQSDIGFKSIGIEAGMISPENVDATLGFGVFANLGQIAPFIALESQIEYWGKSEDIGSGGEARIRDIAIGVRGKYMFETSSPTVRPFAGLGIGMHLLHAEVDIPEQDFGGGFVVPAQHSEDSANKLGLDLGGGMEMPINPTTDFIAEAWYGIVSDVSQIALKVGVAWRMGQ